MIPFSSSQHNLRHTGSAFRSRRSATQVDLGPFVSTWQTDNSGSSGVNEVMLPLKSDGIYNFNVDWGDGNIEVITDWNQRTHTYDDIGQYTISITGQIDGWAFVDAFSSRDSRKLLDVASWGPLKIFHPQAFNGCENLNWTATDAPDLSGLTDATSMFGNCLVLNSPINHWNMSSVTNMKSMFFGALVFNQPLNNWNTSNVTDMQSMFQETDDFNQDLEDWDVSNVQNMVNMFNNATGFNGALNGWITTSLTNISFMFPGASAFNKPINNWNVSNVTEMVNTFVFATSFNQPLSNWDVSNVTNFQAMFTGCAAFDQDLSNWDVSNALDLSNFLATTNYSTANYDLLLAAWSQLTVQNDVFFGMGDTQYTDQASRDILTGTYNWNISDGGPV